MKLSENGLKNRDEWASRGFSLPEFDRAAMKKKTQSAPVWIHFGAGNIFRAFQANVVQKLLNSGELDRGLIVAEGYDYEIIEKMNRPHDEYSILATLKADGSVEKTVVGSIAESVILDSNDDKEFERLKEIFRSPSLQMASFTITEKGYSLVNGKGELLGAVADDFKNGADKPQSYIGKVTSLLYERFLSGKTPIAMVSMDNCSHNGDKLSSSVSAFVEKWCENGLVDKGFSDYIKTGVSFPWSMIDKITPRPDPSVKAILEKDGVEDLELVVTSKNTYVSPFVNAEECEYLVIEDDFPNGRPALEKGGIIFTDRRTVDKVEKMKVCTCLNPLHTALAVFGCLMGYKLISEEMKDPALRRLVEKIGYDEGLPVVVDPGVLDPREFIDSVLNTRLPNPFMPDTPQRIATDTSQKLAIRFGETIKSYERSETLNVSSLKLIPFVFAGWLRYLMAIDDEGNSFELSSDPMLPELRPYFEGIALGDTVDCKTRFERIFKNKKIFGVDLFEVGLADMVDSYFNELISAPGSVRAAVEKYTR